MGDSQQVLGEGSQVGVYGWRKRCLYALVLSLLIIILCTLVATLLIISAISFNLGGLGHLRILAGGVQLKDVSYVLGSLVSSSLISRYKEPLTLESYYNTSLILRDSSSMNTPTNALDFWTYYAEPNRREVTASIPRFRVSDLRGRALFTAEKEEVTVGVDILKIIDGGARISGSVQTSMLRSNLGSELLLESATRKLHLAGPGGVSIESRAADISVSCLTDLRISSSNGKIKLKAPGIYIPNVESIDQLQPQPSRYLRLDSGAGAPPRAYQMCMCRNGKLFVAPPEGECSVDHDNLQCR